MEFGEDADSELQELIMATVSQHQRRKNAEQTVNRMQARLKSGFWLFFAPVGYRYAKTAGSGKVLVRDEPLASIVQEALEGYASGRFETQAEVKRFLERFAEYPRDRHGEVRNQRVKELLTRIVYAGYVDYAEWDVRMVSARHEGLIDLTTYERIQERLTGRAQAPARKDLNADFPLRGFVVCGDCGNPLSACWSMSKTGKRHPYYLCHNKGCPSHLCPSGATKSRVSSKGCSRKCSRPRLSSRSAVRCSGTPGTNSASRQGPQRLAYARKSTRVSGRSSSCLSGS
ncbi:MAG: recombinase family protein [Pseudomonadota bacterium]